MKHIIFGQKTGLRVSELALGTGNFGTRWGHGSSAEESKNVFDRYVEAGGNFIDTADGYQLGESEEILSGLIKGKRHELVLASKYTTGGATMLTTGNSRKNMIRSVEASLKRLNTDFLDLYWAHVSDGQTPIEEIVRGFEDLVKQGKIVYGGFSNYPAWRIANASLLADLRGWSPIAGIQIEYNLMERSAERELLPMAEAHGLGVAFWSPLAGGTLTGKYRATAVQDTTSRKAAWGGVLIKGDSGDRSVSIMQLLEEIAKENNVKVMDVAIAWLRQRYSNSNLSIVTIVGPRTVNQLEDYLNALPSTLSEKQMNRLNEESAIALGSPHEIIADTQKSIHGAGTDSIKLKHVVK